MLCHNAMDLCLCYHIAYSVVHFLHVVGCLISLILYGHRNVDYKTAETNQLSQFERMNKELIQMYSFFIRYVWKNLHSSEFRWSSLNWEMKLLFINDGLWLSFCLIFCMFLVTLHLHIQWSLNHQHLSFFLIINKLKHICYHW